MLHTNQFHGNRYTGSGEEDFWRVFTIYGYGSHLGHMTSIMSINFHFLVPESLNIKFGFDWPSGFWGKQVLSFVCKWPWAKVKKWPWPSILTYLHYLNRLKVTGCNSSKKSAVFTFSYRKACYQIRPCCKIGQGQPRVMIYINFVVLHTLMLHAKFQGHWPSGSGEEEFLRFWAFLSMAAILVMWPGSFM